MSLPPLTTVVCLNVPEKWLFGIDLQFFETTPQFQGIKAIPDGVHIVHWGVDQQSVRSGHFFIGRDQNVVILKWDKEKEEMMVGEEDIGELDVSATKSRLGEYYKYMIKYPDTGNWRELSNHIKGSNIDASVCRIVNSTSTSREENELLKRSIYDSASKRAQDAGTKVDDDKIIQSLVDQPDILRFEEIDLKKSYKEGELGGARTKNLLDKSWYLNNMVLRRIGFGYLMGELQLGYILMLVLANFSGAQQWLKIVELLTESDDDMELCPQRYEQFAEIITKQLEVCPQDYVEGFLEPPRLEKAFRRFFREQDGFKQLRRVLERLGLDLHEEDDPEDAPVVVEL